MENAAVVQTEDAVAAVVDTGSNPECARRGRHLEEVLASAAQTVERTVPLAAAAAAIASTLREAIKSRSFLEDVVEAIVPDNLTPRSLRCSGLIRHAHEDLFRARVMFWPAGFANSPHLHRAWAATGVLLNELQFRVRREWSSFSDQRGDLVFPGTEGEVGYIASPCIHQVENPTGSVSVSLSLFGVEPFEGAPTDPDATTAHTDTDYARGLERRFVLGVLALIEENCLKVPTSCMLRLLDQVSMSSQALIAKHLVHARQDLSRTLVGHLRRDGVLRSDLSLNDVVMRLRQLAD